ncbi:MAG: hypothetical protein ACM3ZV_08220 [Bacillota bacterium]
MVVLLMAMLLAGPGNGQSIGENRMILRDPQQGPTPVIDKFLIPGRVPDCADRYQAQRAAEQRIRGFEPECMLPLKTQAKPSERN